MIRSPFITAEIRHHKEKRKPSNILSYLHRENRTTPKKQDILFIPKEGSIDSLLPSNCNQNFIRKNNFIITKNHHPKNGDEIPIKTSIYTSDLSPQTICSIYTAKINLLEQIEENVKNIQLLEDLSSYMIDIDGPFSETFANDRKQVQSNLEDMKRKIFDILKANKTNIQNIYKDHLDANLKLWLNLEQNKNLSEKEKQRFIDVSYIAIKNEAEFELTPIKANEHYNNRTQIQGQITQKRLNNTLHKSVISQDVSKGDFTAYSFCCELSELLFPSASFSLKEFFQVKCENNAKRSYVNLVINNKKIKTHLLEHENLAKSIPLQHRTCIIEKYTEFVEKIKELRAIEKISETAEMYNTVCSFNDLEELKKVYIEPFLAKLSDQTRVLEATTTETNVSELKDGTDQNNDKFEGTNSKGKIINIDLDVNKSTLIVKDLHCNKINDKNNNLHAYDCDKNAEIHKSPKNNTTNGQSINNLNTKPSEQEAVNESKSSCCLVAELNTEQQYDNYHYSFESDKNEGIPKNYDYSKLKKSGVYTSNKNILNPYEDLINKMPNDTKNDFDCILNSTKNSELHNKFTADHLMKIVHRLDGKKINIRGSHHTFRLGNHSFIIVKHPKSGNRKLSGTYVLSFKSDLIKANVKIEINGSSEISLKP